MFCLAAIGKEFVLKSLAIIPTAVFCVRWGVRSTPLVVDFGSKLWAISTPPRRTSVSHNVGDIEHIGRGFWVYSNSHNLYWGRSLAENTSHLLKRSAKLVPNQFGEGCGYSCKGKVFLCRKADHGLTLSMIYDTGCDESEVYAIDPSSHMVFFSNPTTYELLLKAPNRALIHLRTTSTRSVAIASVQKIAMLTDVSGLWIYDLQKDRRKLALAGNDFHDVQYSPHHRSFVVTRGDVVLVVDKSGTCLYKSPPLGTDVMSIDVSRPEVLFGNRGGEILELIVPSTSH